MSINRFSATPQERPGDKSATVEGAGSWELVAFCERNVGSPSVVPPIPPAAQLIRVPVVAGILLPANLGAQSMAENDPAFGFCPLAPIKIRCPYCDESHTHDWPLGGLITKLFVSKCKAETLPYIIRPVWPGEPGFFEHEYHPAVGMIGVARESA